MKDLSNFFPQTVYFCDCLKTVIAQCPKSLSLQDFCNEINEKQTNDDCIYSVRCGFKKKDNVFSCLNHIPMGNFYIQYTKNEARELETSDGSFCLICIKTYLRRNYHNFLFKNNFLD